jgi:hypothetical protein
MGLDKSTIKFITNVENVNIFNTSYKIIVKNRNVFYIKIVNNP